MERQRKILHLAAAVVLAVSFLVLNVFLLKGVGRNATPLPSRPPATTAPPDGGDPYQRGRIDRVIASVGVMDLDQCAADLSQYNHNFEMAFVSGLPSLPIMPLSRLKQTLADRRTSRLYEHLTALHESQRAGRADALVREKLTALRDYCGRAPEDSSAALDGVYPHAADVSLFLCAVFCDVDEFLSVTDEWVKDDDAEPDFGRPDELYLMSLYLMVLHDKRGESLDSLNTRLEELGMAMEMEMPVLKYHDFYKWNAHTNNTDFTHRHLGVATDSASKLRTVAGFDFWPVSSVLETSQHQVARQAVRGWLESK